MLPILRPADRPVRLPATSRPAAGYRLTCAACQRPRPLWRVVVCGRYQVCSDCAAEYEAARAQGVPLSTGQFVREKAFSGVV